MSEQNRSRVVPLAFHAGRARRMAERRRREGRPLEAVELLRQTAVRSDAPSDWLALAECLMGLACHEQAADVLTRLTARDEVLPETWMLLARCQQALGRRESAIDSLYHYLVEDPLSQRADAARAMLGELEGSEDAHAAGRVQGLVRRGLIAWRGGDMELGKKRLHRAARLAGDPVRIRIALAQLMLDQGDAASAVKELRLALRHAPEHPRALAALCVACRGLGRGEEALALLERAAQVCRGPENEEIFLIAAWSLDAKDLRRRYLEGALRRTPCRTGLLYPWARLLMAEGEQEQARTALRRMLCVDPGDQWARICLDWLDRHPGERLPDDGVLPGELVREKLLRLQELMRAQRLPHGLLALGSEPRMLIDWCFTLRSRAMQQTLVDQLGRERHPVVTAWLRELLTDRTTDDEVRRNVYERLVRREGRQDWMMAVGSSLTDRFAPQEADERAPVAVFLTLMLQETRSLRQSMPILEYAADEWRGMDRRQRRLASRDDAYAYVKAIELLYLCETNQEETALRVASRAQVTNRRLERVMRSLAPHHELLKGED